MARVDLEPLNDALFQLVEFESGIRLAAESLPPRFAHIMGTIDAVVTAATLGANADPPSSSADDQACDTVSSPLSAVLILVVTGPGCVLLRKK